MSEGLKSIQELQELYNQNFFFRTTEGCTDRIKSGETDKDTYLLFAKSLLKLSTHATIDENKSSITQAFGNAAAKTSSVEEAFALEYEAIYEINEWEKICIKNIEKLTEYEALAILATHTGNTSLYSFAAEVEYHARFLTPLAKIKIPFFGRSIYDSAIRADMTIDDTEFEGPAPFYKADSKIVKRQYALHQADI